MTALDKLRQIASNRHQYAQDWKERTQGKVWGYLCTFIPEELIYAAGILPVRIMGSHEPQDIADSHIFGVFCPYSRDCLAQGLQGRYSYLDGVIAAHGCYHIRQTWDSWQRHIPMPYKYYLFTPTNLGARGAKEHMVKELEAFKASVEKWMAKPITREALLRAIEVYNENRRLLRQVYESRKGEPPPISGAQALSVVLASQVMDKREHSQLLNQLLKEISQMQNRFKDKARLMLIGSEVDDIELLELIESLGADIVTDDNCVGSRYFWNEAQLDTDHLSAIAERYLGRPRCPVYDIGERERVRHIMKLARDYRVEGAILVQAKFCDPHGFDMPAIEAAFEKENMPTLRLECDITIPVGQFKTRIEAYLEILQTGVL